MQTPKIRWTSREREQVIVKAIELFNNGSKLSIAVTDAQSVLDIDRQRPATSVRCDQQLLKEIKTRAYAVTITPQKIDAPEPTHVAQDTPSLDSFVALLAKQFAKTFKEEVRIAVKELEHEFKIAKHNPEYESTRTNKPRVIIIGLLDAQAYMIEKEFSNFDISCIDTNRALNYFPPLADAYLLMKNFINHSVYDKYKPLPNHVLIDGGMTALRTWLSSKGNEL
tara:strand:+ start:32857 stop:33528 length:672 start_codon:yes stop_codon:yes gene_type:complete